MRKMMYSLWGCSNGRWEYGIRERTGKKPYWVIFHNLCTNIESVSNVLLLARFWSLVPFTWRGSTQNYCIPCDTLDWGHRLRVGLEIITLSHRPAWYPKECCSVDWLSILQHKGASFCYQNLLKWNLIVAVNLVVRHPLQSYHVITIPSGRTKRSFSPNRIRSYI